MTEEEKKARIERYYKRYYKSKHPPKKKVSRLKRNLLQKKYYREKHPSKKKADPRCIFSLYKLKKIYEYKSQGLSYGKIAKKVHAVKSTVYRVFYPDKYNERRRIGFKKK